MSKQTKFPKVNVLGVEIDAVSTPAAIDHIVSLAKSRAKPVYIVKPYVEFIDRARDQQIRQLINDAYLTLPDGIALVWAAHYQKLPQRNLWTLLKSLTQIILKPNVIRSQLPEAFAGINFTLPLLAAAEKEGLSVFLIGSPKHSSIETTANFLRDTFPKLKISGTKHGYLEEAETAALIKELKELRPDLVLVGMGFPRQEFLIKRLCEELTSGVFIGEGGSFDYKELGGRVKRAPRFIQKMGLEWFWRLLREPKRLKRQFAIPRFIWRVYTHN